VAAPRPDLRARAAGDGWDRWAGLPAGGASLCEAGPPPPRAALPAAPASQRRGWGG
jgi:hypothetical protein